MNSLDHVISCIAASIYTYIYLYNSNNSQTRTSLNFNTLPYTVSTHCTLHTVHCSLQSLSYKCVWLSFNILTLKQDFPARSVYINIQKHVFAWGHGSWVIWQEQLQPRELLAKSLLTLNYDCTQD